MTHHFVFTLYKVVIISVVPSFNMMHKVKDVVAKLLHPSFLFSANNDPDHPKRKRSDSTEAANDEEQIDRTPTNGHSDNRRSLITDDEPHLTDDEDSNSRDVPSTEQQPKRRRTANYQHILSTNSHPEDERTSSPSSIHSVISSSHTTPILRRTSIDQNRNERMTRFRQRINPSTSYRGLPSNYDPSKSPLFSVANRNTITTNSMSNEFSANHLLATSLINRSQSSSSSSKNQPSSATLTNPLSKPRHLFGTDYSATHTRRLPYIERLRRRTLQDCIRLNHTLDTAPLSIPITEEHQSPPTSPVLKRLKAPEKECGIQCDITIVEPSQKQQLTVPSKDVPNEVVSTLTNEEMQTNSSITIEKETSPVPIIIITKPKVLGNITPFSWPKFARAQEEYAKKHPDKCRTDAIVPSIIDRFNVHTTSAIRSQTSTTTTSKQPFPSSGPAEAMWKCPCCTKEHSAQTASCSLCHGINPNYTKLSATRPAATVEKEQVSFNTTSTVMTKESSLSTPVASVINQTTPKANVLPIASPVMPTSTISTTFPSFGATPNFTSSTITKENSVLTTASSLAPMFGIASTSSAKNTPVTAALMAVSSPSPAFGTAPSTITTASSISTSTPRPMFGTVSSVSLTATTKENPIAVNTLPLFGIATTKDNLISTNAQPLFGTTSFDRSSIAGASTSFQIGTSFQPFPSIIPNSFNTVVTSSSASPMVEVRPNLTTTSSLGSFGNTSIIPTMAATPVVSTVSDNQSSSSAVPSATSAPSLITNTSTTSNLFGFSTTTPASTAATPIAFPVFPTSGAFPMASSFTSASATAGSTVPVFGSSSFTFGSVPTTTSTTTTSSHPMFGFGANNPPKSFSPFSTVPTITPHGPLFGTSNSFETTSTPMDKSANPFSSVGLSNAPSPFSFGLPSTTAPTSSAPVAASGGFSFIPQSSAVPAFGASPSVIPPNPFNFGLPTAPSTSNASFHFAGTTPFTGIAFPSPDLSSSTDDVPNRFNIGSGGSTANPQRLVLRARRRPKN